MDRGEEVGEEGSDERRAKERWNGESGEERTEEEK